MHGRPSQHAVLGQSLPRGALGRLDDGRRLCSGGRAGQSRRSVHGDDHGKQARAEHFQGKAAEAARARYSLALNVETQPVSSFLLIQARRLLVQVLIPFFVCVLPPAAALFIAWAIPTAAREFYERRVTEIDMLIAGLGIPLFLCQVMPSWLSSPWLAPGL